MVIILAKGEFLKCNNCFTHICCLMMKVYRFSSKIPDSVLKSKLEIVKKKHSVEKMRNSLSSTKNFVKPSKYFVIFSVRPLLSRNFCEKLWERISAISTLLWETFLFLENSVKSFAKACQKLISRLFEFFAFCYHLTHFLKISFLYIDCLTPCLYIIHFNFQVPLKSC